LRGYRISRYIYRTPLVRASWLSREFDVKVFLMGQTFDSDT